MSEQQQASLSLTRQVDQALDKEIDNYEIMINQFEVSYDNFQKGNLLNECNVQYTKIQSMLKEETLYSRRKKINTLKQKFEKLQIIFIQKFDFEQLIELAKRLKQLTSQFRQSDFQQVQQGIQIKQNLRKLIDKYEYNQPDPKWKKIILDAQQIINDANHYIESAPESQTSQESQIGTSSVFDSKRLVLIGESEQKQNAQGEKQQQEQIQQQKQETLTVQQQQDQAEQSLKQGRKVKEPDNNLAGGGSYQNNLGDRGSKKTISYEQTPLYYKKSQNQSFQQQAPQKKGFLHGLKNAMKSVFSPCTQDTDEPNLMESNMRKAK